MAKMTDAEWKAFCQKTGYKDREGIELAQQKEMEKFMQELERIQYYPTDLSYALDIGEIADMHVDFENGVQVLRMTVVPKAKDEYKTIRVAPKAKVTAAAKRKQPKGPGPKKVSPVIDAENPKGLGDKLVGIGKRFMNNKSKPGFMKDAGF